MYALLTKFAVGGHHALRRRPQTSSVGRAPWPKRGPPPRLTWLIVAFGVADPAGNRLRVGDRHYVGAQFLGRFEGGLDGWEIVGAAMTDHGQHQFYQAQIPICGHASPGFLTSYHPDEGDKPTGKAFSPVFTAANNHHLAVLVGGGPGSSVGVRLLVADKEIAVWRGPGERFSGTFASDNNVEPFELIVHPLADVAGQPLQLEMFDDDPAGHIMLDHVLLVREV